MKMPEISKMPVVVKNAVDLVILTKFANMAPIRFSDIATIEAIYKRVYTWYANTDCVDAEVLAACALFGDYYNGVSYYDMLDMRDWWFPPCPDTSEYLDSCFCNNIYNEYIY